MDWQWIVLYLLLGSVVGLLAGLLGIGGGAVMVPVLASFFDRQGVPREVLMKLALGTSMAAIVLTAVSSVYSHHRHKAVLWSVVWKMTLGVLVGTAIGTRLVAITPTTVLGIIFAVFIGYISIQMIVNAKPHPSRQLPGTPGLAGAGAGIGLISALVAIGGGSLTVPFLTWCNIHIRQAIATSAALGLPIAISGALGYIYNGWGVEGLPYGSVGYVSLPAVGLISATSILTAPVGAMLAHRLPVPLLKKIFAGLLILLSLKMLHTLFGS